MRKIIILAISATVFSIAGVFAAPSQTISESNVSETFQSSTVPAEPTADPTSKPIRELAGEIPFPQSVIDQMITRRMRYHHWLWHQVRENWYRFTDEVKEAYRIIGWEPPSPARQLDATGAIVAVEDNLSGEDFLYMHREMIATANNIIIQNNEPYGLIKGWESIPPPDNTEWIVTPAYNVTDENGTIDSTMTNMILNMKSLDWWQTRFANFEQKFKDPDQLRNMTLAQLGARMEVTVHSYMHMRFSEEQTVGYRNRFRYRGGVPDIDRIFDDASYTWLPDSYSSHANEIFYKIHGWIDARVEDWRIANNLTSIRWNGTWTGGPMSSLDGVMKMSGMHNQNSSDDNMDVLEEAFRIFSESGIPESSFADDIKINFFLSDSSDTEEEGEQKRNLRTVGSGKPN